MNNKVVLKDIKVTYDNVMITCPYHKDGEERKPSCGVSTVDKRINGKIIPAGTVHCFTCGKSVSFETLVSNLLGFDDSGVEGRKYLLNNYDVTFTRQIDIPLMTRNKTIENIEYVSDKLLDEYRYTHDYMYHRGLTDEIIERYDIGYDRINDSITFPVRDKDGRCLFVAMRSIRTKFFTLPSSLNKPLYGVYELDYSNNELFICESFFDALTLAKWGYNAIALMGTGSHGQYDQINKLPFRKINVVLDGDEAGRKGTMRLAKYIDKSKIVVLYHMYDGYDINDIEHCDLLSMPYELR